MFYTFRQNNSGGHFIINDYVSYYVIIEADSSRDANDRAERIGVYFDGCYTGEDCECCGDRWYSVDEYDATEVPMIYNDTIEEFVEYGIRSVKSGESYCHVYYKDGSKRSYGKA